MSSNLIIHKHVHVNYNPLKGMLVLISCQSYLMQLVQKVEVTQGQYIAIYRYQTKMANKKLPKFELDFSCSFFAKLSSLWFIDRSKTNLIRKIV
jgi:hypothetical protein